MHDTLLSTFNDYDETVWEHDVLPNGPPTATLSVDFSTYNPALFTWKDNIASSDTQVERSRADSDSVASLQQARLADRQV